MFIMDGIKVWESAGAQASACHLSSLGDLELSVIDTFCFGNLLLSFICFLLSL